MEKTNAQIVSDVIKNRRSIRSFLPTPVPHDVIVGILSTASRAPSAGNLQPWNVYVVSGNHKNSLGKELYKTFMDPETKHLHDREYNYYPDEWFSPFKERRKQVGIDLYTLLNISKDDIAAMQRQQARNYLFFDAPMVLFFTINRQLGQGSWVDLGMFIQNIMTLAQAHGLGTCAQASLNQFHKIIGARLMFLEYEQLVCGMSIGYANPSSIENTLITRRESLENFVKFIE
jgi:nitroreductase